MRLHWEAAAREAKWWLDGDIPDLDGKINKLPFSTASSSLNMSLCASQGEATKPGPTQLAAKSRGRIGKTCLLWSFLKARSLAPCLLKLNSEERCQSKAEWITHAGNLFEVFKLLIFNWRIISLQHCVGFCHTSAWISHRYRSLPFETPSHLPPHSSPWGCHRALVLAPWVTHQIPTGSLFSLLLSPSIPPSPSRPRVHKSVLYVWISIAAHK